jgi:hypothetical protein
MFSTLRTRFGIPGVISVIALVFAMFGGAYAASNSSNAGKATASAKAKKGPRGPKGATGPAGPQGPAGPAGAKGDAGANGAAGAVGPPGPTGPQGPKGTNGTPGATGPEGSPWTAGGTLPAGQQETGIWSYYQAPVTGSQEFVVPISFPIPLPSHIENAYYFSTAQIEEEKFEGGCKWEVKKFENPDATPESTTPGTLCVFAALEEGFGSLLFHTFRNPTAPLEVGGPAGTYLVFFKKATEEAKALWAAGAWAVSAP